ncbi:MAG TPA: GreA/GreB family elongation factor, partial [Polyangiaceae bacterium]|nr:GreA/GreB family elongation factor [Polyangiaceae bacterium]
AMSLRPFRDDQPIAIGALVQVEEDDQERLFFIAPEGGGTALADGAVQVVTPRSPLGRALLGKRVGDVCSLSVASRTRELAVVGIE